MQADSLRRLTPDDVRPGDILLYVKTRRFDEFVRLLDGGTYTHAGVSNGTAILEALPAGVVPRPLVRSILHAATVDVFRLRVDGDGRALGEDPAFPPEPVLRSIAAFEAERDRYAYDQLVLLSALCLTRKVHLGPQHDAIVREFLDSGAEALARIAARGREPMLCSELVYRCYAAAGPQYRIKIRELDDEGEPVIADFVTPRDLETSPNLERIGRLKG